LNWFGDWNKEWSHGAPPAVIRDATWVEPVDETLGDPAGGGRVSHDALAVTVEGRAESRTMAKAMLSLASDLLLNGLTEVSRLDELLEFGDDLGMVMGQVSKDARVVEELSQVAHD